MKRGELYLAALHPRSGAEVQGDRPVLVVSHDGFNRVPGWKSVTVVPLTTSLKQARRGPTAVCAISVGASSATLAEGRDVRPSVSRKMRPSEHRRATRHRAWRRS